MCFSTSFQEPFIPRTFDPLDTLPDLFHGMLDETKAVTSLFLQLFANKLRTSQQKDPNTQGQVFTLLKGILKTLWSRGDLQKATGTCCMSHRSLAPLKSTVALPRGQEPGHLFFKEQEKCPAFSQVQKALAQAKGTGTKPKHMENSSSSSSCCCLIWELGHRPGASSRGIYRKLPMISAGQSPTFQDTLPGPSHRCPDSPNPSAPILVTGCSFSKACKAPWLGPNESTF